MKKKLVVIVLVILLLQNVKMVSSEEGYGLLKTIEHPEGESKSMFGCDIVLTENHLIIGDKKYYADEIRNSGKVYVFDHDGTLQKELQSDEPKRDGEYGAVIDILDEKLVIVEMEYGYVVKGVSKVFFYDQQFSLTGIMSAPDTSETGYFGTAMAYEDDLYIISEPGAYTDAGLDAGQVHVYDDSGNHVNTYYSEIPKPSANFGIEMVADDSIVVIAEQHGVMDMRDYKEGFVYLYDFSWNHISTLSAPNPGNIDKFGSELALGDEYIYIGDKNAAVDGVERAGEVYIYDRSGKLVNTISAESPSGGAYFGHSIDFCDGLLIVGEPSAEVSVVEEGTEKLRVEAGRIHVYNSEGVFVDSFTSLVPMNKGYFGKVIAGLNDRIYVSEPGSNVVHIFEPGAITEQGQAADVTSTGSESETAMENDSSIPGFSISMITIGILTIIWVFSRKKVSTKTIQVNIP
jgi:hypothetical protein